MTTVRQTHREHGFARHYEGAVGRDIGTGTTMWLEVCVVSAKQLLGPRDPDFLCDINFGAATVIPAPRVAFGVLVAKRGP